MREIVAIREAARTLGSFSLEGCEIYSSCEPCPMCLGAILWGRLAKLYYANSRVEAAATGFDDAAFYDEVAAAPAKRALPASLSAGSGSRGGVERPARQTGQDPPRQPLNI